MPSHLMSFYNNTPGTDKNLVSGGRNFRSGCNWQRNEDNWKWERWWETITRNNYLLSSSEIIREDTNDIYIPRLKLLRFWGLIYRTKEEAIKRRKAMLKEINILLDVPRRRKKKKRNGAACPRAHSREIAKYNYASPRPAARLYFIICPASEWR